MRGYLTLPEGSHVPQLALQRVRRSECFDDGPFHGVGPHRFEPFDEAKRVAVRASRTRHAERVEFGPDRTL
jgi:hypothetical protein